MSLLIQELLTTFHVKGRRKVSSVHSPCGKLLLDPRANKDKPLSPQKIPEGEQQRTALLTCSKCQASHHDPLSAPTLVPMQEDAEYH